MARAAAMPEPPLFSAINVTPFIDVLLVLLIVLILDLPPATNNLPIELPGPGTASMQVPHQLAIDARGGLRWDGGEILDTALPVLLARVAKTPHGMLTMSTDPEARYERFDSVLAVVKHAGITRLTFEGNRPLED